MCDATPTAEAALPADLSAARHARAFVRESMCHLHRGDLLDHALLLVSELAVNAVEHGHPPVRVGVDCGDGVMRIQVSDASPVPPVRRTPSVQAESGRGVALVDRLSRGWGVLHDADGKTVWCELTLAR